MEMSVIFSLSLFLEEEEKEKQKRLLKDGAGFACPGA